MKLFTLPGRNIFAVLVVIALCFVIVDSSFAEKLTGVVQEKRVSFEFHNQPMSEVASKISEQLNYKVLMDDELASVPVSGKFVDVTLDDFFSRRIFRGKNVAILFDDAEHEVVISSLGKKSKRTEYDRTTSTSLTAGLEKVDPMDMEVQPGVKRRDVEPYVSDIDPMDQEVQPGVTRRDVEPYVSDIDPMDQEIQPGVIRRDVPPPVPVDPNEVEVQPGVKRIDVAKVTVTTDPLDMEVQPGIKRRDILQFNN